MTWRRTRHWWTLAPLAVVALATACGSTPPPEQSRYTASIDPCRLPDPKTLIYLTHDLVEVPLNTVPPLDRPVAPLNPADKPDEFKTCEKVYAYENNERQLDLRGLRYVTIAVATFQGSATDANTRAHKLILQSRCEIQLVLSLVVAVTGSGLMAAAPPGPVEHVGWGMGGPG